MEKLTKNGEALFDIWATFIHVGCPFGNSSILEIDISNRDYNGQPVLIDMVPVSKGAKILETSDCAGCNAPNAQILMKIERMR